MTHLANLPPKRTGLPFQVWYSAKVPGCTPAIKVPFDNEELSIEIESLQVNGCVDKISLTDLDKIKSWITLNKDILLKYWYEASTGAIDNVDVVNVLKKV